VNTKEPTAFVTRIADPLIRAGVRAAIERALIPAKSHPAYPGHFTVTVDGRHFGSTTTWPGLDSWEMAGAYLLLGEHELVCNYFAFVRAAQRHDGNIPMAILPGEAPPWCADSYFRAVRYPQDVYEHRGQRWLGMFHHWQVQANPLSVLAPICYVLTADEIVAHRAGDDAWLRDKLPSIDAAARYVLSRKNPANGLIGGAGFYIECPPRDQWDGITQCYAIDVFRKLAAMHADVGNASGEAKWSREADVLAETFRETFWCGDHFAEYVHPTHGVVDLHGLSDVNFAAIGLHIATDEQAAIVWPKLTNERAFWEGGMPTQLVSRPSAYETWEHPEPLPFAHANGPLYDVAAMGRVWYLESLACARMNAPDRLRESARLVCAMGERHGWQWHERYHATGDGAARPAGPAGYCEYAAVLVRVVLGNVHHFI
jgi:hypothetical protein